MQSPFPALLSGAQVCLVKLSTALHYTHATKQLWISWVLADSPKDQVFAESHGFHRKHKKTRVCIRKLDFGWFWQLWLWYPLISSNQCAILAKWQFCIVRSPYPEQNTRHRLRKQQCSNIHAHSICGAHSICAHSSTLTHPHCSIFNVCGFPSKQIKYEIRNHEIRNTESVEV